MTKRLAVLLLAFLSFAAPCAAFDSTAVNGVVNAKNINRVLHVGHPPWSGDVGAQINAAYAALPSSGGTIVIDPPASGTTYDFSTPIVLATAGKIVRLEGAFPAGVDSTQGVTLNYTPTSGAAITLDYATNIAAPSSGLLNINLINNGCATRGGCGGSAVGISIGNTNEGDAGASYTNVKIQGFDIGYYSKNGGSGVDQTWTNPSFWDNNIALKIGAGITERFISGVFVANDRIVVSSTSDGNSELYFVASNMFDNTGVNGPLFDYTAAVSPSHLTLSSVHLEDCGTGGGCTRHYVGGSFNLTAFGGVMESDATDGTCDYFINSSSANTELAIYGVRLISSCTMTAFVNTGNSVTGVVRPTIGSPSRFPTIVAGSSAGLVESCATQISGTTPLCQFPYPVTFKGPITLPAVGVSGLPTCDSTQIGKIYVVPNASAPTYLGTLSGGGSTYTLALCNGTNWVAV